MAAYPPPPRVGIRENGENFMEMSGNLQKVGNPGKVGQGDPWKSWKSPGNHKIGKNVMELSGNKSGNF